MTTYNVGDVVEVVGQGGGWDGLAVVTEVRVGFFGISDLVIVDRRAFVADEFYGKGAFHECKLRLVEPAMDPVLVEALLDVIVWDTRMEGTTDEQDYDWTFEYEFSTHSTSHLEEARYRLEETT